MMKLPSISNSQHKKNDVINLFVRDLNRVQRDLETQFLTQAQNEWKLHYLQNSHPEIGGMCVNLYHGVSNDSVQTCAQFMIDFAEKNPI